LASSQEDEMRGSMLFHPQERQQLLRLRPLEDA
jgi:hypothetical protein